MQHLNLNELQNIAKNIEGFEEEAFTSLSKIKL
jgi:hypothetical protein